MRRIHYMLIGSFSGSLIGSLLAPTSHDDELRHGVIVIAWAVLGIITGWLVSNMLANRRH
jgi:hypothetical protein